MQFKLEFIINAEEDRLLEAVNEYLYHSYKDLSEVPEDEIIDALLMSDIINDELNYNICLDDIKVTKIDSHESLSNTRFY